jgi:6-phosphogluconolactonase
MNTRQRNELCSQVHSDARTLAEITKVVPRRQFLGSMGGLLAVIAADKVVPRMAWAQKMAGASGSMFAYVGCYTTEKRHGHGKGINVYRMDPASGNWSHVQLLENITNPSFLALDHRKRFLYSVHGDMTYASAYAIDASSGHLTKLNQQDTGGTNGVHLAIDPSNRFLVVANYTSGSVTVLPINADGTLAPRSDLVELQGKPGPNPTRQTSSHPHQNPFDPSGRFLLVPDLGLDKIFVFRLDTDKGKLVPADMPGVATQPGAGPRHVDFHPSLPYVYAINELASTMVTYRYDAANGGLKPLQSLSTLPSDFTGESTTAEVAVDPSGKFVYGSNRGHDSIVIYSVDQSSGLLTQVGWKSTEGKTPRYFGLDPSGTLLYAGNQDSDTVVTFRIDQATGKLTPTGQVVHTGSPVTIVFS